MLPLARQSTYPSQDKVCGIATEAFEMATDVYPAPEDQIARAVGHEIYKPQVASTNPDASRQEIHSCTIHVHALDSHHLKPCLPVQNSRPLTSSTRQPLTREPCPCRPAGKQLLFLPHVQVFNGRGLFLTVPQQQQGGRRRMHGRATRSRQSPRPV